MKVPRQDRSSSTETMRLVWETKTASVGLGIDWDRYAIEERIVV